MIFIQKFWFFIGTNVNFFAVSTFTISLWYLRTSTSQILSTLTPLVILVLSYFVLKEKLHLRYLVGTLMCLTGAIIIEGNEKKAGNSNNKYNKNNYFISVNTNVSNKILVKNKILIVTQMLYFGIVKFFLFFYLFIV